MKLIIIITILKMVDVIHVKQPTWILFLFYMWFKPKS